MAWPTITVEAAFGINPLTTPTGGQWVDISSYVRSLDIKRGRQHELSRTEPGTIGVTLVNTDRRFDPAHTSGPYYGQLLPMTRIRIKAVHASITYELAQGFVDDWGQTWPGRPIKNAGDAEVVVKGVDAFKIFALYQLATYRSLVLEDAPIALWPLDELTGSTANDIAGSSFDGTFTGSKNLGSAGPLAGGKTSVLFSGGWIELASPTPTELRVRGDLTIEAWVRTPAAFGSGGNIIKAGSSIETYTTFELFVASGGVLQFRYTPKNTTIIATATGPTLTTSTWYHIAVTKDASGRIVRFWINGVNTVTAFLSDNGTAADTDANSFTWIAGETPFDTGRLANVAIYNKVLAPQRIAAHADVYLDIITSQATGAHLGVILDAIGWPAGERVLDTGISTLQEISPSGSGLDWLSKAGEDSEFGLLFMRGDGKIRFLERHALLKSPYNASQATIGDDATELVYADLTVSYNDADLWNIVEVTREGGTAQRVEDTASQTSYGPRALERSGLIVDDDLEAGDAANALLLRYKAPALRPDSVRFEASQDSALWVQLLTRDIGDRVTIKRRPPGGGSVISILAIIEGIEHQVTPFTQWTTTWKLAPADPNSYWILGTSTLGTDTRLAF